MERFLIKPSIDMQYGIRIDKDTNITFENEKVKQEIKDLVLHSVMKVVGVGYTSTYDTTIQLQEGDVLIFEEDERGYIKPVEEFMTLEEAIEELKCIE